MKSHARKKGMTGRRADRYVYSGLNNAGLMHGNKPTRRGLRKSHRKHHPVNPSNLGY